MTKIQSDAYTQWKNGLIDVTLSATATLTSVQENVELDSTGAAGAFTVTLPDITSMTTNKRIWFYDNGNAGTNNITIIANTTDGSAIDDGDEYIVDQDNRIVKFELIHNRWMVIESAVKSLIVGAFSFEDNATGTTISTVNTFTDIAGTGIASTLIEGFDFSTPPNVLTSTFTGSYTALLTYSATVSRVSGNAPREIAIAAFQDTGSGFAMLTKTVKAVTMTGSLTNISGQTFVTVSNGDAFKAMVENRDSIDNILVSNLSYGVLRLK